MRIRPVTTTFTIKHNNNVLIGVVHGKAHLQHDGYPCREYGEITGIELTAIVTPTEVLTREHGPSELIAAEPTVNDLIADRRDYYEWVLLERGRFQCS
jgi:hypothetical protein